MLMGQRGGTVRITRADQLEQRSVLVPAGLSGLQLRVVVAILTVGPVSRATWPVHSDSSVPTTRLRVGLPQLVTMIS